MNADEWTTATQIIDDAALATLKTILDKEGDLIVEHRFYRGARAPYRFGASESDALVKYLTTSTSPGDSFYFWSFERCCTTEGNVLQGKVPDGARRAPLGGAY